MENGLGCFDSYTFLADRLFATPEPKLSRQSHISTQPTANSTNSDDAKSQRLWHSELAFPAFGGSTSNWHCMKFYTCHYLFKSFQKDILAKSHQLPWGPTRFVGPPGPKHWTLHVHFQILWCAVLLAASVSQQATQGGSTTMSQPRFVVYCWVYGIPRFLA